MDFEFGFLGKIFSICIVIGIELNFVLTFIFILLLLLSSSSN